MSQLNAEQEEISTEEQASIKLFAELFRIKILLKTEHDQQREKKNKIGGDFSADDQINQFNELKLIISPKLINLYNKFLKSKCYESIETNYYLAENDPISLSKCSAKLLKNGL